MRIGETIYTLYFNFSLPHRDLLLIQQAIGFDSTTFIVDHFILRCLQKNNKFKKQEMKLA